MGKVLKGILSTTPKGVGFVAVEGRDEDVVIPAGKLVCALRGDEVEIRLLYKRAGQRQEGEVTRILMQGNRRFVGTIRKKEGKFVLVPDDMRIYTEIALAEHPEAEDGLKALVDMNPWTDPNKLPTGTVRQIIGRKGEHETEMQSIIPNSSATRSGGL